MKPDPTPESRKWLELWGSLVSANTTLRVAVLVLALACGGLLWLNFRTRQAIAEFKPLVVRIDEVGRAEAVRYNHFAYKPQDAECKYFLSEFVRLFYGRSRFTVREDTQRALWFLEGRLASGIAELWTKNKTIEGFLADPAAQSVEVSVQKVALIGLRTAPYRATVDYEKVYRAADTRQEQGRRRFTGTFVFDFRPVDNDLVQKNPLGLTILDFREDEAFR